MGAPGLACRAVVRALLPLLLAPAALASVPLLPASTRATTGALPYYGNTHEGDCAYAAEGELAQMWLRMAHRPVSAEVKRQITYDVQVAYHLNGEQGLAAHALRTWEEHPIGGIRAVQFAALDRTPATIEGAISQLGGIYAIVTTPPQTGAWTLERQSASSRTPTSHAVAIVGYTKSRLVAATWGKTYKMTWGWWHAHAQSAWAVLPSSFVQAGHGPISSVSTIRQAVFGTTWLTAWARKHRRG